MCHLKKCFGNFALHLVYHNLKFQSKTLGIALVGVILFGKTMFQRPLFCLSHWKQEAEKKTYFIVSYENTMQSTESRV